MKTIKYVTTTKIEWEEQNVQDVYEWTVKLLGEHPELNGKIKPIIILYHGRLGDLYPELDPSEHWNQELLKKFKEDKERFEMELNEPMCKNKCPRERIVIRINDDVKPETFKLKTEAFKFREAKQVDAGEVDIEMELGYSNDGEEQQRIYMHIIRASVMMWTLLCLLKSLCSQ